MSFEVPSNPLSFYCSTISNTGSFQVHNFFSFYKILIWEGFFSSRKRQLRSLFPVLHSVTVTRWSFVTCCDFQTCLRFWGSTFKSYFDFMRESVSFTYFCRRLWRKPNKKDEIFSDPIVLSKMCFEYKSDIAILDEHPQPGLPYAWLILKKKYSCMGGVVLWLWRL